MKSKGIPLVVALLAAAVLSRTARAYNKDDVLLKMASSGGCMTCHRIESGAKGPDGMAPALVK